MKLMMNYYSIHPTYDDQYHLSYYDSLIICSYSYSYLQTQIDTFVNCLLILISFYATIQEPIFITISYYSMPQQYYNFALSLKYSPLADIFLLFLSTIYYYDTIQIMLKTNAQPQDYSLIQLKPSLFLQHQVTSQAIPLRNYLT